MTEIKPDKKKMLFQLSLDSLLSLGGICVLIPVVLGIIRCFREYGFAFGILLSGIGVLMCILWLSIVWLGFLYLFLKLKLMRYSILVNGKDFFLKSKDKKIDLPGTNLFQILDSRKGIMFIWRFEDGIKTFLLRKQLFNKISYATFQSAIAELEIYCDNPESIIRFKEEYNLNHIFRKNKIEHDI